MRAFSVLHGFWLSANDVELGVGDHEDMAHHVARAFGATFDFQLDAVCGVRKARAAATHFAVCHRAQINQNPKRIASVELLQIHVFSFIFFFHKEAAGLFPHVLAFDAIVAQHVGRTVLIVTLTFVTPGKTYFSESLVPAVYGSTKRRKMPFMDLLWALSFMFSRVSVFFLKVTTLWRIMWS